MPKLDHQYLKETARKIFLKLGASEPNAEEVSNHLVNANLTGHDSHGVIRIDGYMQSIDKGWIKPQAQPEIEKETPGVAIINGNWGFGQCIAKQAVKLSMKKAKENGIGSVAVHRCNHIGRLGEYGEMVTRKNMAAMIMGNGAGWGGKGGIAPFGAMEGRLGTNPICYAFPTGTPDWPIIVDIACATSAEGKISVARNRGEEVPEGVIIDAEGNPTTDPEKYYGPPMGAILPFGGHKGYGIAVIVDMMAGLLSGGGCTTMDPPRPGAAMFVMTLDVETYQSFDWVAKNAKDFINHIKSATPMPEVEEVLTPYEPEVRTRKQRLQDGIYVEDKTWKRITEIAAELGIPLLDG